MIDKHNSGDSIHPTSLGAYVAQQRQRLGLSQRQLAAQVGMHHSRLARLESGEVGDRVSHENIQGLADALGVDVSKLLKYLGVTPKPELPSVRVYFRRKLGVDADEAEVLEKLVAEHQKKTKESMN